MNFWNNFHANCRFKCVSESSHTHYDCHFRRPANLLALAAQRTEWHEVDWDPVRCVIRPIVESVGNAGIRLEVMLANQALSQRFKLFPSFHCEGEIDIPGRSSRGESKHVLDEDYPGCGADEHGAMPSAAAAMWTSRIMARVTSSMGRLSWSSAGIF